MTRRTLPRILLIEDDSEQRRVLRTALEHEGYVVREAANGSEALELLAERAVDLIVMDVVMPGMGGRELLIHLHERHPDIPVVLISGFVSPDDPSLQEHHTAVAVFGKPLDPADIVAVAERLIP